MTFSSPIHHTHTVKTRHMCVCLFLRGDDEQAKHEHETTHVWINYFQIEKVFHSVPFSSSLLFLFFHRRVAFKVIHQSRTQYTDMEDTYFYVYKVSPKAKETQFILLMFVVRLVLAYQTHILTKWYIYFFAERVKEKNQIKSLEWKKGSGTGNPLLFNREKNFLSNDFREISINFLHKVILINPKLKGKL